MVWLNGSILHDPPEKIYECRNCRVSVIKHPSGDYDIKALDEKPQQQA
jgi:hypothetical protein